MQRWRLLLVAVWCLCVQRSRGLSFVGGDVSCIVASARAGLDHNADVNVLSLYKESLVSNPLATKMCTGACLAMMGDAIAQARDVEEPYDRKRAISFGAFDAVYRAGQHFAFPVIVEQCRGQYLGSLLLPTLGALGPAALQLQQTADADTLTYYLATMEQTLVSQLGIVPFLYYPVFFTFTALIQGLDADSAVARAKENFIPLMKRNLLFWIPVQFVQFGFVEEGLQIPFLSICGLAWTFILSLMAGSTKTYAHQHQHHDYCVNGNEPGCEITDQDLFPNVPHFQEDIAGSLLQALDNDESQIQPQQQQQQTPVVAEAEEEQLLLK